MNKVRPIRPADSALHGERELPALVSVKLAPPPSLDDDNSWEAVIGFIEDRVLPAIDQRGASLFLPPSRPLPAGPLFHSTGAYLTAGNMNQYACPQLEFVLEGRDKVRLEDRWFDLMPGDGLWVPANAPYAGHASERWPIHEARCLWFTLMPFGVVIHRCHAVPGHHISYPFHAVTDSRLTELYDEWRKEVEGARVRDALAAKGLLLAFFCRLKRAPRLPIPASPPLPPEFSTLPDSVRRAVRVLHQSYNRKFDLQRVSRFSYVSPFHLCRLFRRHLGTTPLTYLTRLRMQIAHQLLNDTDLGIADIAHLVGYSLSVPHFIRIYTREFNALPSAKRRRGTHHNYISSAVAQKRQQTHKKQGKIR